MKPKEFFLKALGISILIIASFVLTNYFIDIYGLFHNSKGKSIKVYADERTAKYLFSFNYIPQNFEGILVGPSLSDNLNTKKLTGYKIYNASMMGANISGLKYLINNSIERGNIKWLIICLDPYITKDFGIKSSLLNPKQYYGALGSTSLFKTYLLKFIREHNIFPEVFPKDYINSYGYYNFNLEFDEGNAKEKIMNMVQKEQQENMYVDPRALRELNNVLNYARQNNVEIIAYFSPIPYQILDINRETYKTYQEKILPLFNNGDIVINLNKEKYKNITSDFNTFIDHGHLSEQGQAFVLRELNKALNSKKIH